MCIDDSLRHRAGVHAALGDPQRLAIVDALALSDCSPSDLGEALRMPSNLLAHHVDVLERAGVVERLVSSGDRRRRYLRLRRVALEAVASAGAFAAREVVFVCTQNSARSQLAAAIWNEGHLSPAPATSAGMHPAERVHPGAVAAAARHGLDLRGAVPQRLGRVEAGLLLVTVCDRAREELGGDTRGRSLHWSIDDPVADGGEWAFEAAFSAIEARVRLLAPAVRLAA